MGFLRKIFFPNVYPLTTSLSGHTDIPVTVSQYAMHYDYHRYFFIAKVLLLHKNFNPTLSKEHDECQEMVDLYLYDSVVGGKINIVLSSLFLHSLQHIW